VEGLPPGLLRLNGDPDGGYSSAARRGSFTVRDNARRLQRVEERLSRRQAAGSHRSLRGGCGRAVRVDRIAVAEVLADEVPGHLIQEQAAVGDLALLAGCQGRHDEAVADVDVDVEPVPRPPRRWECCASSLESCTPDVQAPIFSDLGVFCDQPELAQLVRSGIASG
jgi:hypothetical protein